MPLFVWKKDYSVGVDLLDDHHKNLFRILNVLYENTMQPRVVDEVLPIIAELREYTRYHFAAEELHMQDKGFPEIADHIVKHRNFTHQIEELQSQHRNDDLEDTRKLIVVLGNWLLNHVLVEDRKYSEWHKGDGI